MSKTLLLLASMASAAVSEQYLIPMADSYIARGVEKGFGYGEATLYTGIQGAIAAGDDAAVSWYRGQIDGAVVAANGKLDSVFSEPRS